MSKYSRAVGRKVGNNSSGVVALMFMSSSLVRELRVPSQKTVLKQKTKQNNAHQHAEATICGAILVILSLWDGLDTSATTQVMVMGATNRPQDVDPAILRRMPATFHIGLPNTRQRQDILKLILMGENLSNAINLREIAERTDGYSGSDLRELCRDAAMYRVRDYVRREQMRQIAQQLQEGYEEEKPVDEERLRPVTQLDLLFGLDKMKESKQATVSMSASVSEVPLD